MLLRLQEMEGTSRCTDREGTHGVAGRTVSFCALGRPAKAIAEHAMRHTKSMKAEERFILGSKKGACNCEESKVVLVSSSASLGR